MTVYYLWRAARSGRGPPPTVPAFTNIYIEGGGKGGFLNPGRMPLNPRREPEERTREIKPDPWAEASAGLEATEEPLGCHSLSPSTFLLVPVVEKGLPRGLHCEHLASLKWILNRPDASRQLDTVMRVELFSEIRSPRQ